MNELIVYSYDAVTKHYVDIDYAQPSPLEEGVFLIPAHATTIEPPQYDRETEVAKFDNEKWIIEKIPEKVIEDATERRKLLNKYIARDLLLETDWIFLPDINISNKDEFIEYRKKIREIAKNPPSHTIARIGEDADSNSFWPVKPEAKWTETDII